MGNESGIITLRTRGTSLNLNPQLRTSRKRVGDWILGLACHDLRNHVHGDGSPALGAGQLRRSFLDSIEKRLQAGEHCDTESLATMSASSRKLSC